MDVTSQPRATACLQIREPRKPLPPQTTSFFAVAWDMVMCVLSVVALECQEFGRR